MEQNREEETTAWLEENKKEGDFEFECWLSTDGKHTVRIKAMTKEGRDTGLLYAKKAFDRIMTIYGTKQAQAVKEYSSKTPVKQVSAEECNHPETMKMQSKSQKNPGRWFYTCKNCHVFLGWVQ